MAASALISVKTSCKTNEETLTENSGGLYVLRRRQWAEQITLAGVT